MSTSAYQNAIDQNAINQSDVANLPDIPNVAGVMGINEAINRVPLAMLGIILGFLMVRCMVISKAPRTKDAGKVPWQSGAPMPVRQPTPPPTHSAVHFGGRFGEQPNAKAMAQEAALRFKARQQVAQVE